MLQGAAWPWTVIKRSKKSLSKYVKIKGLAMHFEIETIGETARGWMRMLAKKISHARA